MPITNVKGGFTPRQFTGLQVWLDAGDTSSMSFSSGSNISQWRDKSGLLNHATATSTPVLTANNINGYQAIVLASGQYFTGLTSVTGTTLTVFAVALTSINLPNSGTDQRLISLVNEANVDYGSSGGVIALFNQAGGSSSITTYRGGGSIAGTGITQNVAFQAVSKYDGTDGFLWKDGNLGGSSASSGTFAITKYGIGNQANPTEEYWIGSIGEVLIYNVALGDTDRRDIEGYLAQKWDLTSALPAGHPGLTGNYLGGGGERLTRQSFTKIPYFSVFTPLSFTGCTLWLDASQDTTANGGSIASLVDRSGSGNSLTPSGTIRAATNFLRGRTVYNFGSSRASKTNFPWQTSFTQIVLVKGATGKWLSSLVSEGSYLAYIYAGNESLINVNTFFSTLDSSVELATSVFTTAADGASSWVIFSIGYQSDATIASNYTINGTVRTTTTSSSSTNTALSSTNQLWLNGNASFNFDTGTYVAEMFHYNSVLTNSQRQQIEGYLAQKWGLLSYLPNNHGFYTNPAGGPQLGIVKANITMTARPPDFVSAGLVFYLDAGNASSYPGSGSTWTDLAGSGLITTLYNSPTYSSANGGYLSFVPNSGTPANSQYAQTSASLSVLIKWSIEVWHYYTGTFVNGQPCILTEVFADNAINFFLGTLNDATAPELQVGFFSGEWNITTPITLTANRWYHLVGTYDGSNVKLYVNNVLTQTYATNDTPVSGGSGIRFMRRWDQDDYWGGRLAIVRIYDGALTTGQINTNFNASISRFGGGIVTTGLLFHLDAGNTDSYPGSGSTWYDLVGSGLTTTLYNSPTYSSENGGYLSFVPSSSQYAQTSASLSSLSTWTIEVWHYYNGITSDGSPCILTDIYGPDGVNINFFLGSLNTLAPGLQVGFYKDAFFITSDETLPATGWYHLVGTYDGANVKLYVNNVLTQTYATNETPLSGGVGIRFMRTWNFQNYWGGGLAVVRIYNGAFGAPDVSTNYNASKTRFGLS